jgi:hypothetical protein
MAARKLNQREKRMLLIGGAAAVAIVIFTYGAKGIDRWSKSRTSLAAAQRKLGDVETDKAKLAGLLSLVPVFETPQAEEKQMILFREKVYEQLKKAGVNVDPPQPLPGRKINIGGIAYKSLKFKCKGKCKFDQLLTFLAGLPENPYLVGVEELRVQFDTKEAPEKRRDKEIQIDLVVSTFFKDVVEKSKGAVPGEHASPSSL